MPSDLLVLTVLLGIACASDVWRRRIPNVVVLLVFVSGLWVQWSHGGTRDVLWALAVGAGFFAVFFLPWMFKKLGGGDLKLFSAVAVWIGPRHLVPFIFCTALASFLLALFTLVFHQVKVRNLVLAAHGADISNPPRATVPVAVAITCGALITLFHRSLPW